MKLQHIPMGARFEYQGVIYSKTGPMLATAENGEQKLIPRYAVLKPLDGVPVMTEPASIRQIDASVVTDAFERFFFACSRLVDESARLELAKARQQFLDAIKK